MMILPWVGVTPIEVANGGGGLDERVCPVDSRRDLPRFDEFSEHRQVSRTFLCT